VSDTDSFIEEVTEEVRRDRLFGMIKRYGWIAVLVVLAIVGGTAYNEYRKANEAAIAQRAGDAVMAALENSEPEERIAALGTLRGGDITQGAKAVIGLLQAAEQGQTDDASGVVPALESIAADGTLPEIYRQIASFKLASQDGSGLEVADRKIRLEALSAPGMALRLLATEQLALIDIEQGDTDAALDKLQNLVLDAEVTQPLRQRASQIIIALGQEPNVVPGAAQISDAVADN
jgi:hypothetical protein